MNPFLLYLILKLDTFIMASVIGAVAGFGVLMMVVTVTDGDIFTEDDSEAAKAILRWWKRGAALVAALVLAAILLPSTKQVAAIYVLSALTQDETLDTIQKESGELYGLFKEWLRSEIEVPEREPTTEETTP